ncbi:hypothetical protein HF925_00405 [Acidithiobacillus ferriphilus]|uniref:hypothetical protein n=1 Tax=Acidithiobacillus ferriphilus TaxID=1689834 RepID=UPI001C066923|nr:hypothetical protein [Acidithiobacillus ferriphilus]MBU2847063.1 hypothetical protein [Acidithiobacillus ferriphilus]
MNELQGLEKALYTSAVLPDGIDVLILHRISAQKDHLRAKRRGAAPFLNPSAQIPSLLERSGRGCADGHLSHQHEIVMWCLYDEMNGMARKIPPPNFTIDVEGCSP